MTEPEANSVLDALELENLITPDQRRRLERAVSSGKALMEALRAVPLVEPVQYLRACGLAERGGGQPRVPERSTQEVPLPVELQGARRDSTEGIYVLDIGDIDADDLPDAPAVSAHDKGSGPAIPDMKAFASIRGPVPQYDLRDDEGINLIRDANEILLETAGVCGGLVLRLGAAGSALQRVDSGGAALPAKPLDAEAAESIATRLRVMARIQPRHSGMRLAAMYLKDGSNDYTALVESTIDDAGSSVVAVRVAPGRLATG